MIIPRYLLPATVGRAGFLAGAEMGVPLFQEEGLVLRKTPTESLIFAYRPQLNERVN